MTRISLRTAPNWTAGALALVSIATCGPAPDAAIAESEKSAGQILFEENCVSCHGDAGLGDGPMAASLPIQPPSLMEHLGHHPMDQLVRIIRTGVPPAMPPAPLTDDQVLQVIDYAWTLVPDSMVAGLREMQRMAEMGMEMDMDSAGGMPEMDHDAMGHGTAPDTTRR